MATVKCFTCDNRITEPHEWNNWDLWCADCHTKTRGAEKQDAFGVRPSTRRKFFLKVSRDGRARRGGY